MVEKGEGRVVMVKTAFNYQSLLDTVPIRAQTFRKMRVAQRLAGPQPNLSRSSNRLHFSPEEKPAKCRMSGWSDSRKWKQARRFQACASVTPVTSKG